MTATRLFWAVVLCCAGTAQQPAVVVHTESVTGIGAEVGVVRRDPSDVVAIGPTLHVFYTKVVRGARLYPSGYGGTVWHATSEDGGKSWAERGEVLGRGPKGAFDATAVFTPNAVVGYDGELYLYYTAVGDGFDNKDYEAHNRTAIGIARLELGDDGAVVGCERLNGGKPILEPTAPETGTFDSFRVDDAALVLRHGHYWLYYKGRAFRKTPAQTKMGVAIAKDPAGPYRRQGGGEPVQPEGHEVLVWATNGGVASLATSAGRGLWFSHDGLSFRRVTTALSGRLRAPGGFRPELSDPDHSGPLGWGVHMGTYRGDPFLERFRLELPDLPAQPATVVPVPSALDRPGAAGWKDGRTWQQQHEDIYRIGKERAVDLVFLGDSITQSWGGLGRQVWAPAAEVWERHYGKRNAANFGISGDRTQHLLWRIDHGAFDHVRPKVVVLLVGTNNIVDDSAPAIVEGIAAIVRSLRWRLPEVKVLLLGLLPRGEGVGDPVRRKVRQVNDALAALALGNRVSYRDIGAEFVTAAGRPHPERVRDDTVHLTPVGYATWAAAIDPDLARLLGEGSQGNSRK